jgi:RNase P subunit RPR2
MIKAFRILSDIQRRSKQKRRPSRYIPFTCRSCGVSDAYPQGTIVCEKCGSIGELIEWRRIS